MQEASFTQLSKVVETSTVNTCNDSGFFLSEKKLEVLYLDILTPRGR